MITRGHRLLSSTSVILTTTHKVATAPTPTVDTDIVNLSLAPVGTDLYTGFKAVVPTVVLQSMKRSVNF